MQQRFFPMLSLPEAIDWYIFEDSCSLVAFIVKKIRMSSNTVSAEEVLNLKLLLSFLGILCILGCCERWACGTHQMRTELVIRHCCGWSKSSLLDLFYSVLYLIHHIQLCDFHELFFKKSSFASKQLKGMSKR